MASIKLITALTKSVSLIKTLFMMGSSNLFMLGSFHQVLYRMMFPPSCLAIVGFKIRSKTVKNTKDTT